MARRKVMNAASRPVENGVSVTASKKTRWIQVRWRLLFLVVLVGPLIGLALTKGLPHQIFTYVLVGIVVVFLILILIAMLATRRGREAFVGRLYGGLS
jgi:uncharacterized membrane protein YfcA